MEYYRLVKKNKTSTHAFTKILKTDWGNKARCTTVSDPCYLGVEKTFRKDMYRGISVCVYVTE